MDLKVNPPTFKQHLKLHVNNLSQSQLRNKSKMWMDPNTASSTHDISSPAAGAMFYWIALLNVPQSVEPFLPGSRKQTATSIDSPLYVPLYLSACQHIHYSCVGTTENTHIAPQ